MARSKVVNKENKDSMNWMQVKKQPTSAFEVYG